MTFAAAIVRHHPATAAAGLLLLLLLLADVTGDAEGYCVAENAENLLTNGKEAGGLWAVGCGLWAVGCGL